jgi:hypothetical protein
MKKPPVVPGARVHLFPPSVVWSTPDVLKATPLVESKNRKLPTEAGILTVAQVCPPLVLLSTVLEPYAE